MHYKFFILLIFSSFFYSQSIFNRWTGSESFNGSVKSTSMGNTHLLNSIGSANTRSNPANLIHLNQSIIIDMKLNNLNIFERWSMPVRDSFDEILTYADYVANEFANYDISMGIALKSKLKSFGEIALGLYHAPLSQFNYQYSEEVRGKYKPSDDEIQISKDPIVGYQNLQTKGKIMISSIGISTKIDIFQNMDFSIGISSNFTQSTGILDVVTVDTLYSEVTNLSTYPDIETSSSIYNSNFLTLSAKCHVNSNISISALWENSTKKNTNIGSIDPTNGLLKYWDNITYADSIIYTPNEMYYLKPALRSYAFNYSTNTLQNISISFEYNDLLYGDHSIYKDYSIYKFGFEYITQMGTPIRGGLCYQTPKLFAMSPISMFTFGTGKTINNLTIDIAGTYSFYSFKYPDLFPVENDTREDYDLIRESQLQLQLALTYTF